MSEVLEGYADESYNLYGRQRMGLVLDCFFQHRVQDLKHVYCSDLKAAGPNKGASQYSTELK